MSSVNHEDINLYVVTPSLDPTAQGPFLKRSEAHALWEDAVRVVDKVWPFVTAQPTVLSCTCQPVPGD